PRIFRSAVPGRIVAGGRHAGRRPGSAVAGYWQPLTASRLPEREAGDVSQQQDVYTDLIADGDELDALVAGLEPERWSTPTPAPGWTVAHQVAHLAFVARLALLSASQPEAFLALAEKARTNFQGAVDAALAEYLAEPPAAI